MKAEDYSTHLRNIKVCEDLLERNALKKLTLQDFKKGVKLEHMFNGEDNDYIFYVMDTRQILKKRLGRANVQHLVMKSTEDPLAGSSYDSITHQLKTSYSHQMYGIVRDEVMSSPFTDSAWVENEYYEKPCFVGLIQINSNKTATTLITKRDYCQSRAWHSVELHDGVL